MRRFLITHPSYTGEIEAVYDTAGKLMRFDLSKTNISAERIEQFKKIVPALVENIGPAFSETKAIVVEADFDVSLDDFKREYPYSRNFHLLNNIWAKMKKSDQVQAYYAAIEYRKYCERNTGWNYKPKIAASWLTNQEYKNDWKKM